MGKVFFHVDLDAFFASVEQRDNPQYRGRPLIIGQVGPRSVVSTCSYEARAFGVHSAMPSLQAYKLCPQGIFIPGNMKLYSRVSHQVMDILSSYSPDMHQASIDEAYLDMTGTSRLFGPPRQVAVEMKERIRKELGITLSVGIAANPFIAKMASDYNKPDGLCVVAPGKEQVFIDAIGLKKIWGLGKSGYAQVLAKGFESPAQIRELSEDKLQRLFGTSFGSFLFKAVRGQDIGMFQTETKSHSISTETTFIEDITKEEQLHQILISMSREIMFRALDEHVMAKTVGLKLRWGEDFRTITVQNTPEDPILNANQVFSYAKELLASKWKPGQGIRLIGLGLYQTYDGDKPLQDSLFSEDDHRQRELDKVIHKLDAKGLKLKKASEIE